MNRILTQWPWIPVLRSSDHEKRQWVGQEHSRQERGLPRLAGWVRSTRNPNAIGYRSAGSLGLELST